MTLGANSFPTPTPGYPNLEGVETTLNGAQTIDLQMLIFTSFRIILDGNLTLDFSNIKKGCIVAVELVQDATGGRTVTFDSKFKWGGGVAPTVTAAANACDTFMFLGFNDELHEMEKQDVK